MVSILNSQLRIPLVSFYIFSTVSIKAYKRVKLRQDASADLSLVKWQRPQAEDQLYYAYSALLFNIMQYSIITYNLTNISIAFIYRQLMS